jgi:hypothetical protein
MHSFNCPRTCPQFERRDLCRFMPLLSAIGAIGPVTSHTTTVKVRIRSNTALAAAVRELGGNVIGLGAHALYGSNTEQGYGVTLPGWRYPIVLKRDGSLAFDVYGRTQGPDIARLTARYVLHAAREAAGTLGWRVVSQGNDSVTIAHRSGGKLTVHSDGRCDATGFTGAGCHVTRPLEDALGEIGAKRFKPEYYTEQRQITPQSR